LDGHHLALQGGAKFLLELFNFYVLLQEDLFKSVVLGNVEVVADPVHSFEEVEIDVIVQSILHVL
jgi:hypothetical protein